MSESTEEDLNSKYERITNNIADEIGRALETAPPKIRGALFILSTAIADSSGFASMFGGAMTDRTLFKYEVRRAALCIVQDWLYENFERWRTAADKEKAEIEAEQAKADQPKEE